MEGLPTEMCTEIREPMKDGEMSRDQQHWEDVTNPRPKGTEEEHYY